MATSPLFSKHKSYIQRKIINYCQSNFNSSFPSSDSNINNDNNLFAKFHRDAIEKKNNIIPTSHHIVDKMKNDYLIKNKDSQGDLNMNILSNPYISNKFKDKIHDLISVTPNESIKRNYLNSMRNQFQEKSVFERKQKELMNLITDNGSVILTQRGKAEGSFLHNSPERGFTNDKISKMEKFIEKTIHTPRGDYLDSYRNLQEQNKKERLIKNQKKQNEQRQLDDYVNELTERRARNRDSSSNENDNSKHSKAKSDFLSSFFV